jgi:hypothetical protein
MRLGTDPRFSRSNRAEAGDVAPSGGIYLKFLNHNPLLLDFLFYLSRMGSAARSAGRPRLYPGVKRRGVALRRAAAKQPTKPTLARQFGSPMEE